MKGDIYAKEKNYMSGDDHLLDLYFPKFMWSSKIDYPGYHDQHPGLGSDRCAHPGL
jgi:hypothetical protein